MGRKNGQKVRGVFERPVGSDIWWINYYVKGRQHREKVGRKSDAIALYQNRKADARRNIKLPELQPGKVVTFGHLMEDVVKYAKAHLTTAADYEWKQRALTEEFGSRPAAEIRPKEIDDWLQNNCKTAATANRFKSFFSLAFQEGMKNYEKEVQSNPARLVKHRREDNARLRYLTEAEYKKLLAVVRHDHPRQAPAFILSVYTGMRWGEQFALKWYQVDLAGKKIRLTKTKNREPRTVPLNSIALAALKEQKELVGHKPTDLVFPEAGDYCRFWFEPSIDAAKLNEAELIEEKGKYTWHNNRHTFCSWLAKAGVPIKTIQELAGHKRIEMSARYAHLSPETTATASERLVKVKVKR
jgi:integrase